MSILDVLKQRLAERPNNNWRLANMVGKPPVAARSGIPGVNDVIRPGDPSYSTTPAPTPAPAPAPSPYAQPVYDKQLSSYNRLEGLRNANAGYGGGRFYAQGEIYTYDPALQGYRGSISGSVIQQPQGPRPAAYEGYANNGQMFPVTPEKPVAAPAPAPKYTIRNNPDPTKRHVLYGGTYGGGGGER